MSRSRLYARLIVVCALFAWPIGGCNPRPAGGGRPDDPAPIDIPGRAADGPSGKAGPSTTPPTPPVADEEPVYQGKPLAAWLAMLRDEDVGFRRSGVAALEAIGPRAKVAAPALAGVLGDSDAEVRRLALVALGKIGPDAKHAIPSVALACKDGNPAVRAEAVRALGKLTTEPAVLVPPFEAALRDNSGEVRETAARGLAALGPGAKGAVPALITLLPDTTQVSGKPVSGAAADALVAVGREAVPALIPHLRHPDAREGRRAAQVLGRIGPAAGDAVPELIEAAKDARLDSISVDAIAALRGIGPAAKDATGLLTSYLTAEADTSSTYRAHHAAKALAGIGPAAHQAVGPLITALARKDPELRRNATEALGRIGPAAVPQLIAALRQRPREVPRQSIYLFPDAPPPSPTTLSFEVHDCCTQALGMIGKAAVPELVAALREPEIQRFALSALGRIGPEAKAAVPEMTRFLTDTNPEVRRAAAQALGGIGPAAKPAVPQLLDLWRTHPRLRTETNPGVWNTAEGAALTAGDAVKRIDPEAARVAGIR